MPFKAKDRAHQGLSTPSRGLTMKDAKIFSQLISISLLMVVTLGIIVFVTQQESPWSILGNAVLLTAASFIGGGIVGFIFGIPRSLRTAKRSDDSTGAPNPPGGYASNTNLEEISDWLTKILVGAGLSQLALMPGYLRRLVEYLTTRLNLPNGEIFILSLLLAGAGGGFLVGYICTRIFLPLAFANADRSAETERSVPLPKTDSAQKIQDWYNAGTEIEKGARLKQIQDWITRRFAGKIPTYESFNLLYDAPFEDERKQFLIDNKIA